MLNDVTVFNIREYLSDENDKMLGEAELKNILSEFSCKKNSDVEKNNQSNLRRKINLSHILYVQIKMRL